jgi:DNA invertase Pin-like site-specific DNA recombinase
MAFTGSKVDLNESQRLLDEGNSVREVAISQGVSTQAVYRLIQRGTLMRAQTPSTA